MKKLYENHNCPTVQIRVPIHVVEHVRLFIRLFPEGCENPLEAIKKAESAVMQLITDFNNTTGLISTAKIGRSRKEGLK